MLYHSSTRQAGPSWQTKRASGAGSAAPDPEMTAAGNLCTWKSRVKLYIVNHRHLEKVRKEERRWLSLN